MSTRNRRQTNLTATERAYRQGLRRRTTDRADTLSYYAMLSFMLAILITLGVLAWRTQ